MIENADSRELRTALEQHLQETKNHIARLDRVFTAAGIEPSSKSNAILAEMMDAARDSVSNIDSSPLREAALILNGNQVEHYETALYGTLAAFAQSLGLESAVRLLRETLDEEKRADTKLTELAETLKNPQAARHQTAEPSHLVGKHANAESTKCRYGRLFTSLPGREKRTGIAR